MNSLIRIATAVNKVNCANPQDCLEEIKQMLGELPACDILAFPKLALCSPSCGSLFAGSGFLEQCGEALDGLCAASKERDCYIVVGLALEDWGKVVSVMAVLYEGELVALVPTVDNPSPFANSGFSEYLMPTDTVFSCGGLRFCILGCNLSTLTLRAAHAAQTGCDLILVPAYSPMRAGMMEEVCAAAKVTSASVGCAIAVVNGGVGDTSSPYIFSGFVAVYECGVELTKRQAGYESFSATVDLDVDIIHSQKKISSYTPPRHAIQPSGDKPGLLREIDRTPFLPKENTAAYLDELFALQVRSLVARMENIGVNRLVVGVSGGLDSTATLLVSAAAMDVLDLPRTNILGITMPGFGTSDRTYFNALSLLGNLGVTQRDISIRQAVQQHFEDIGHSGKKDITYENAQARERTQILLDVANATSAIVVGTGDLSEEALGFCTFAGDHIANYNVNSCITKTVLRSLVLHIADNAHIENVSDILRDILDTPVSPELLPPADTGEIKQATEEILGPYELHDFFLYYFVKYRFRPSKLYFYACMAFADKLKPAYIKQKLAVFFKRFCAGQFKRACAPDSASITEVNLSNVNYYIPSDLDPSFLLRELEAVDF